MKVYEPQINGEDGTTISPKNKMKFINDYYIGRSNSAIGFIALGSLNSDYEWFYGNPCKKEDFDKAIDALYSVVATNRKLHGKSNDKSNDKRSKR